jgi:hypothetical protein
LPGGRDRWRTALKEFMKHAPLHGFHGLACRWFELPWELLDMYSNIVQLQRVASSRFGSKIPAPKPISGRCLPVGGSGTIEHHLNTLKYQLR